MAKRQLILFRVVEFKKKFFPYSICQLIPFVCFPTTCESNIVLKWTRIGIKPSAFESQVYELYDFFLYVNQSFYVSVPCDVKLLYIMYLNYRNFASLPSVVTTHLTVKSSNDLKKNAVILIKMACFRRLCYKLFCCSWNITVDGI